MSELDKEAVLDEFTAAYKKAHGKQPKVEDSNGWYSVDGGKNMRLAQLDEWTQELKSDSAKKTSTSKAAKKTSSKSGATKTTKKSSTQSAKKTKTKSTTKKTSAKSKSSGNSPAEAWQAHLDQQAGKSRLPRGLKSH